VVIFTQRHFVDDAADVTQGHASLKEGNYRIFFEKIGCRQVWLTAGDIHFEDKGRGMLLIKSEADHCRGYLRQTVHFQCKTPSF
jgi:hypothetical protein